jgi:hypothetical protein
VPVMETVKMDDEELYVPDDALEEAPKFFLKNHNYVVRKNWKNLPMNENQ